MTEAFSPLFITKARRQDVPAMYRISRQAHLLGYGDFIAPGRMNDFIARYTPDRFSGKRYAARMLRRLDRADRWLILSAYRDGRLAGYTLTLLGRDRDDIKNVFVDPAYQGQGIGDALFGRTLEHIGADRTVILSVLQANGPARSLYEKHGFAQTGIKAATYFGACQVVMARQGSAPVGLKGKVSVH